MDSTVFLSRVDIESETLMQIPIVAGMSSFIQSLQNDKQEIARKKFVQRSVMR